MLTYRSGTWYAVAAGDTVALMAPDVGADTLTAVWRAMATGDGLAVVLEGLVGSFGASLSSLPPFAVATRDAAGSVRVIVRGACTATVDVTGADAVQVTGLGVTTWTDRTLSQVAAVRLTVAPENGPELPLAAGVVPAGSLVWMLRSDATMEEVSAHTPDTAAPASQVSAAASPTHTGTAPTRLAPDTQPAGQLERAPEPAPVPAPTANPAPDQIAVTPARSLESDAVAEPSAPAAPPALASAGPGADTVTFTSATLSPDDVAPALGVTASEETRGYDDFIFGETRVSTVEDAAVRTAGEEDLISAVPTSVPAPAASPAPPAMQAGDHDGETLSAEQFAALRAGRASALPAIPAPPAPPTRAPVLVLSTGQRCVLDRSAVVGRRPRALHATGVLPHLVTVPSPQQDISRSHVELRVDGVDVVAVDLDTVNGTRLLRAGQEPVRLGPGQPTLLVGGDRLDLGDGIMLSFEGL